MSRKHLFPLVVLLAAASVAGLLVLGRAVDLGQPAGASTGDQPAIAFRVAELDKAEKSLRQQLTALERARAAGTQTVYERASAPVSTTASDDHSSDDDHSGDDDHHKSGERDD